MPLYEYECESCCHRFEKIQKFSDPPADVCPSCGKGPIRKLMSSPAIQFKGSGWYITDYARKSDGGKGSSDGKDAGAKASTDSAGDKTLEGGGKSADSKPAESKSETKSAASDAKAS
jgi:putative FmdB family regulatory protein